MSEEEKDESTSVVRPSLPVKRRRSFGGANGVWWRRHRREPESTKSDNPSTTLQSPPQSDDNDIEWDEELCRPIYKNKTPVVEEAGIVSDGNEDASPDSSPTPSSPTIQEQTTATAKCLWTKAPVKRKKSFSTRKRPYSVVLMEANQHSDSSSPSTEEIHSQSSNESTALSFLETNDDSKPKKKQQRQRRILPKEEAKLQKQRQFFEQLDATQSLTIDNSIMASPHHSKIVRTSYKVNLQSPTIQAEYSAYSKALVETGVSPCSMETFAANRRDVFRKRELFDGFLDG